MLEARQLEEAASAQSARQLQALEQRIQRLEEGIGRLQDTRALEERLAERVSRNVARQSSAGLLVDAGRRLLPAALAVGPNLPATAPATAEAGRSSWLLIDLYQEVRAIFWMFRDWRYRRTWACWLLVPALVFMLFCSWFILGSIPFVGMLLDKTVDIVLVILAYKILSREARRYTLMIPQLPAKEPAPAPVVR
jgi:hypothetical protein